MAPTKNKPPKSGLNPGFFTMENLKKFIYDPHYLKPTCFLLFLFEIILNIFIIERVNYTEIDWKAYMQEVEGFMNGTWDYKELKGDTGPLVYPAGFVYVYSLLYAVTSQGRNIYLAQYIFLVLYLGQTLLTYRIFLKTAKIPPYALVLTTLTSYRIHSIYVLRLFNDPIAVLLFYISLNLFISNRWLIGSFFYSLAVSIKMNILLYAPCLLIAYLTNLTLMETILNLSICALVQVILGAPFLYTNPFSYIKGSFDLGRVFEHTWTVNYRFLPREIFENRLLHLGLLSCHVLLLLAFAPLLKRYLSSYAKLKIVTDQVRTQLIDEKLKRQKEDEQMSQEQRAFLASFEKQIKGGKTREDNESKLEDKLSKVTQLFVLPFFVTNLIGIVFARSLHYQFYCWYFHSLLYLVFCTGFRRPVMFLLLGVLEYCWNVYPSTDLSSASLHLCHFVLLFGVYRTMRQ
ncbi:lethal(2)neighbour of tid protein [Tribolium castaneum]|uniref:dolichyl-P-Man:Man5GlcNAc2-PP-dolichol alpha-1,3-mannosyltransferase n=1 Tax=Tribolium castaneum TaxID=7070 RepID=D2A6B4_TRICA|nr:PREDICTED: lethal(2)neighbour of tid protein [Tribolium castaneum]EFA05490.1 Lethal(2)neighbour of tid protein-like Protein [Tribolium castaneum]|eukprot:XP_967088.1 PREDICTED: lethal(2)neighbour of tid protein [Tribolium castaneum]